MELLGPASGVVANDCMISGEGKRFNRTMVARIRSNYGLQARYSRLRARGMLTLAEIAKRLDISTSTAKTWRCAGLLRPHRYNDRGEADCQRDLLSATRNAI
jgi:hypothetical protein